jgi:hypothetical protein
MGRCIKCGITYCTCPADGICDTCASKEFTKSQNGVNTIQCGVTETDIQIWKARIECAADTQVGMTPQGVNVRSYIISAWNYRNNPCMFYQYLPLIRSYIQLLDINNICRS